jgi:hypothetical protein
MTGEPLNGQTEPATAELWRPAIPLVPDFSRDVGRSLCLLDYLSCCLGKAHLGGQDRGRAASHALKELATSTATAGPNGSGSAALPAFCRPGARWAAGPGRRL